MRMSDRDRRDWSLLIFIVPLGILLMLIAGQFAMRVIPRWILNTGMGSSLKVETAGGQETFMEPLFSIQILTPFSWQNTYLTPNADSGFVFPPFVVLEPSATPSPTEAPSSTETAATPPETVATTVTPSATVVVTATTPPPPQDTSIPPTDIPTDTSTPPTDIPTDAPTTVPTIDVTPTPKCTDPAATNFDGPLPCTYTPIPSTPDPTYTIIDPPPSAIGVGTNPEGGAGAIGLIPDKHYVVLGGLSIVVQATPDNNYDLAYYEFSVGTSIHLDWVIIGISNVADGSQYYEVFNWGNGIPDANSNIGDVAGTEVDDQTIDATELYDPDGTAGPAPQTGILIDVDNATSHPPADTYNYLVIISPPDAAMTPIEDAQVDAVQTVEVPIPPPTPTP